MKKYLYSLLTLVFVASMLHSCTPDDNIDDPFPDVDTRDKFVGSWLCNENSSQNGSSSFTVGISLDATNSSQVILDNFYNAGYGKKLNGIATSSSITIPNQSLNSLYIRGSGSIFNNDTKMNWNYYVDTGADIDTCTAVFTKQ